MQGYAIGLPGLAVLALGFLAFALAVLAARARRGVADQGPQRRSRRSIVGIAVQSLAFFATAFGAGSAMLDPLSTLALTDAAVIALLMAAAVALFVWASRTMGRNWCVVARTRSTTSS
jgi:protein-S-isoprenylcysteine O-methyltransferase Ste14